MRKGLTLILMALAIMIIAVSCEEPQVHVHTYSEEWEHDESYHWHKATCEHTDETDGKERHTFGSWKVDKEATEKTQGEKHHVCTVCGYEEKVTIPEIGHTHNPSSTYKSDGEYHWQVCSGCGNKVNLTKHTSEWAYLNDINHEYKCTVCGYAEKPEAHDIAVTSYQNTGKKEQWCTKCSYTKSLAAVETKTTTVSNVEKAYTDTADTSKTTTITIVKDNGETETKTVENSKIVKNTADVTIETKVVAVEGTKATDSSNPPEATTKVTFPEGALKMEDGKTNVTLTVKALTAVEATASDSEYQGTKTGTVTGDSGAVLIGTDKAVVAGFEFILSGANTSNLTGTDESGKQTGTTA